MNLDGYTNIALALALFLVLAVGIGVPYYYVMGRFNQIEKRVDALWDYLIKGAQIEAVTRGLGTLNSPLIITNETRKLYSGISEDLKRFYLEHNTLNDTDLFQAIAAKFGDVLLKDISLPNNLSIGSVTTVAVEIAKETLVERDTDVIS